MITLQDFIGFIQIELTLFYLSVNYVSAGF
jgi:hypothetical protein